MTEFNFGACPKTKKKRDGKKEEKKSESFDTDPISAGYIGGHSISDDRPVELVAFRSADKVGRRTRKRRKRSPSRDLGS